MDPNQQSSMPQSPISQPTINNGSSSGNKWKLILSAIIILVFAFGGATYYLGATQNKLVSQNQQGTNSLVAKDLGTQTNCSKIKYAGDQKNTDCLTSLAVSTKDASICEKIRKDVDALVGKISQNGKYSAGDVYAETCYSKVGPALKDLSLCNKIESMSFLKSSCYNNVATSKEDPNICKQLANKDDVGRCLSSVGIKMKSTSICDQIERDYDKEACYEKIAETSKDLALCTKLNLSLFKNYCYGFFAKQNKDYKLCQKLDSSGYPDVCFIDVAKLTNDTSICGYVKDIRDSCYSGIAINKNDPNICQKYANDKDLCLSDLYLANKDIQMCPSITNSFHRDRCYLGIVTEQKSPDPSICGKITDIPWRDDCYRLVAINTKNSQLCNFVQAVNWKNSCLSNIGILTNNLDICNRILINQNPNDTIHDDQQRKDECYDGVATATKDKSLCQSIKGEYYKSNCLSNIERGITSYFRPTPTISPAK